jgi:hypothetical protein
MDDNIHEKRMQYMLQQIEAQNYYHNTYHSSSFEKSTSENHQIKNSSNNYNDIALAIQNTSIYNTSSLTNIFKQVENSVVQIMSKVSNPNNLQI